MKHSISILALIVAVPAFAEEKRQLDAHEHGVGALNIAFDGSTVEMELEAPGADIVGFEYAAETKQDRASVDAAVATLAKPLDLFVLPAAAECSVTQASASLETEDEHDDHHDDENHDDHDDHADHDDHEHDHDKDEDHADHDGHDDHEEHAGHSEFHAEYTLACGNPTALNEIAFAYFETFENARELDVQIITNAGAQAFEVTRDAPVLDLRSLF